MHTPLDEARVAELASRVEDVKNEMAKVVVGQTAMIEGLILGLLTDGHLLLEGVPGLAKTLAVKTLAGAVDTGFKRIQFTPDMLPASLIGAPVYAHETGTYTVNKGPVFSNIVLADEINRAPALVQSALLEVMEERQVTILGETFPMDDPFMVLATQNPIEHEGTFPLPEAQMDRFVMKLVVEYPDSEQEYGILNRMAGRSVPSTRPVLTVAELREVREAVNTVHLDEAIGRSIVAVVAATRDPEAVPGIDRGDIEFGASPRATLALAQVSRARALLAGRNYVNQDDVKRSVFDVLRHRILLTYEADARRVVADDVIRKIREHVFQR